MAFDSTIIHWPTISAFTAYLQGVPRPAWVKRFCNHNTYRPDETQWHGMKSMETLRDFYRDVKHWSSAPHLFLAASAPSPADTGIFQLTPITHPGTHAGACNADALGLESVGDFDRAPPSAAQYTLLIAVNLVLMRHWGLPPENVVVHRDCMPGRTCPGKYLTSAQIRADLNKAIARPTPAAPKRYRVREGLPVYQRPERTGPLWGFLVAGEEVIADATGHLEDERGWVDLNGLVAL